MTSVPLAARRDDARHTLYVTYITNKNLWHISRVRRVHYMFTDARGASATASARAVG